VKQSLEEQTALDGWSVDTPVETARACVACGYSLFGLGDEPRCPECGLRNIPDEFRRQVWELVDSGKWFFSGPFELFRKRLPGWWWALDRAGDLRRALRVAVRNAAIAAAIVFAGAAAASAIAVESTTTYRFRELDAPTGRIVYETSLVMRGGLIRSDDSIRDAEWGDVSRNHVYVGATSTSRFVLCRPSWQSVPVALAVLFWLVLTWAGPLFVGLVTQIRKGLPKFARPPHTIIAAGAYESHRLICAAASSALGLGLAGVLFALNARARSGFMAIGSIPVDVLMLFGVGGGVVLYVALGWVAPLRSDWTKQLIQSRGHVARIVVMYALLLPLLATFSIYMLVVTVQLNRLLRQ